MTKWTLQLELYDIFLRFVRIKVVMLSINLQTITQVFSVLKLLYFERVLLKAIKNQLLHVLFTG